MDNLILIAAIGANNELGMDNKLIWHIPDDLKFFKEQTMGKPIVMGYNTFVSLPKMLPNRKHLVLTHRDIEFPEGVLVFHSKEELLEEINKYEGDVFVIGGGSIYRQFLEDANQLLLTEIDAVETNADTFFPIVDENWEKELLCNKEYKSLKYSHNLYKKITK